MGFQVKSIKEIASSHGLKTIRNWNISQILKKAYPKAIKKEKGWTLTVQGENYLSSKNYIKPIKLLNHQNTIKDLIENIQNEDTKNFLIESKNAIEYGLHRSAVVLTWIGAISLMQENVIKNNLNDFNHELIRRFPKAKKIKAKDDFSLIKEYDFLQICNRISLIGKNVKQELEHLQRSDKFPP